MPVVTNAGFYTKAEVAFRPIRTTVELMPSFYYWSRCQNSQARCHSTGTPACFNEESPRRLVDM